MSTLKAEVVRVEVAPHPNADRLDLCKVKGWQCVAQKGQYATGDLAVYIPIDSVLPPELVAKLGIEKFYSKRIKTLKLRGYISQGMLAPISFLTDAMPQCGGGPLTFPPSNEGADVTDLLGIAKYEEPIPMEMAGKLLPDEPGMLRYTDIENIKNHPDIFGPDDLVVAREKIHGSNFRAAKLGGKLFVGSHRRNLARDEGNLYWRAAAMLELDAKLGEGEQVFAEVYGSGVQDLSYGHASGKIAVAVFDLLQGGRFLSENDLKRACSERFWPMAPLVYEGKFCYLKMPGASLVAEPKEQGAPLIIEGVVIRPAAEEWSERLQGRKILKSISDEYLLRKEGTERH